LLATLLGFALRMIHLADVPPRWDEGWSVAHAALSLPEIFTITAADVHPPLYYLALGAWQWINGIDLFGARYLSALMSASAVPLAYVAANVWSGSRRVGVLAAFFMAWLPLGAYYGAVIRMYALAPSFVLLATYSALRIATSVDRDTRHAIRNTILFVIGAAGAMLTLYHAVWGLVAAAIYGVAIGRRSSVVRRLLCAFALTIVVYLPWAIYAGPQFLGRASAESATNIGQQYPIAYFIRQGIYDLTLSQQIGDAGVIAVVLIIVVGCGIALARRKAGALLMLVLPTLMIGFTLVGVAFAARQWAFNARMLICAVPALAFALAWAFDQMLTTDDRRSTIDHVHRPPIVGLVVGRLLAGVSALALIAVYFSASADFVYRKSLEVFDPYNPHTYRDHIAPRAQPNDVAFFNVLSPAGFYALDRSSDKPNWSYALTWDPVIEPRERWESRLREAAQSHSRLWLVLYRGLAGKNGELRGWMDSNFYPAHSEWGEEEVYYGMYGAPHALMSVGEGSGARWGNMLLSDVRIGTFVQAGDAIPVALTWRATAPITTNYKVFVHALDSAGRLIAQHDAQPLNDLRPMTTLPVGEDVLDNHGLALPLDFSGDVKIMLGMYDPATGDRLRTSDGRDAIEIGVVAVASATK
jgi:hypothetical protein